jgi:hypothetical protein
MLCHEKWALKHGNFATYFQFFCTIHVLKIISSNIRFACFLKCYWNANLQYILLREDTNSIILNIFFYIVFYKPYLFLQSMHNINSLRIKYLVIKFMQRTFRDNTQIIT